MIFIFNALAMLVTLALLLHMGLSNLPPIAALRDQLREERRLELVVSKCAQHLANQRNLSDALRYLISYFPQKKSELQVLYSEFSEKISLWQHELHCPGFSFYPLSPALRQNFNLHLHPYWPNFVSAYYLKPSGKER
jgi:hypothetical protein